MTERRVPMDWTSGIINELARHKRAGLDFEAAWKLAFAKHRPSRRDVAGVECADLFEAAQSREEPITDFLKRVTGDAWHGRNPQLRLIAALAESDVFPVADRNVYQASQVGRNRAAA